MEQASMKDVAKNMRVTGMLLFRDALLDALKTHRTEPILCVVHMAQAAEILLKARIAQEHPLLIFSKIPAPKDDQQCLSLSDLLEGGRTFSYMELPNQLWATTSIKIDNKKEFCNFGSLRNQLVHFSRTNQTDLDLQTLKYGLDILDPLVKGFWGKSVIDFINEDPWMNYGKPFKVEIEESHSMFEKVERHPRLRGLLGDKAVQDWGTYKKELEEEKAAFERIQEEENLYMSESLDPEVIEQQQLSHDYWIAECEGRNAQWQSFLDNFADA
jgi:hypothetical protein